MTRSFLLFSFALLLTLCTRAQDSLPYWSLAGNSSTGSTAKLGTFDPDTLNLITNNQRRILITPQGAVLIGPTIPSHNPIFGTLTVTNINNYSGTNIGILSTGRPGTGVLAYGTSFGVIGQALGAGSTTGVGGAGSLYGVYGSSEKYAVFGGTETGYGVYGSAISYGFGGYFQSKTGSGLVARTFQTNGYWAGIFYGNVYASGHYTTSDKRLKKNIAEINDATALLRKLKPRTYEFSHEGKTARMNLPQGKHWGLIAQDVETVLPTLVADVLANAGPAESPEMISMDSASTPVLKRTSTLDTTASDKETIKVLNYTELIPILIKAAQEQDEKIQRLEKMVQELRGIVLRKSK